MKMKKQIFWCLTSFGFGLFLCGWCLLVLSQRASVVWAADSTLKMSIRFEQAAKQEFAKNNQPRAQDFITAAFLIRRDLAEGKNRQGWPIDMPTVGFSAPWIGIPDFVAFTEETVASKKTLLLYKCAVVALSDSPTQAIYLQEIQKEFPKITLEGCKAMGMTLLKS